MEIKLSRFCTPKGSNQALAYTLEFEGTTEISPETNRTLDYHYEIMIKSLGISPLDRASLEITKLNRVS